MTYHLLDAPKQYQELDSILALNVIRHSVKEPVYINYVNSVYPLRPLKHIGDLIKKTGALSLVQHFNPDIDAISLGKAIRNPLYGIRLQLISKLENSNLQPWIRGFFALPFGTTYSPIPGALYALLTPSEPYANLDKHTTAATRATQIVFHCGVLAFYFCLINSKVSSRVAFLTALSMLSSISLYTYGYHLGSTVWNFSTSAIWLWALSQKSNNQNWTISFSTSILIFANYLISLYWITYFLISIFEIFKNKQNKISIVSKFLISQLPAIISLASISLLFLQEAEGIRGASQIETLGNDLYFATLNFFAFSLAESIIGIQFIFFSALTCYGLLRLLKSVLTSKTKTLFEKTNVGILITYVFFVYPLLRLTFLPSRHLLFLAPVIFYILAFGIEGIFATLSRYFSPGIISKCTQALAVVLVVLAMWAVVTRTIQTQWKILPSEISSIISKFSVESTTVSGNGFYAERQWPVPTERYLVDQKKVLNKTYAYISQETPFESSQVKLPKGSYIRTLYETNLVNNEVFASAFVPLPRERFRFSRPYNSFINIYRIEPE